MDIASLRAFLAVAETGSFSRAAGRLHLTQPAVSKRVAALESELDLPLFDRIGKQVQLTEGGRALLPRARRILLELEDSRRVLRNLSEQVGGELRIATSHHIGLHHLPPALRRFAGRYPAVELDLHFMESEEACEAIHHGDLELAVITLPPRADADLQQQRLWPDPMAVVVGRGHPLFAQPPTNAARLLAHAAILPERGTYTRALVEGAFGKPLRVRMATNYLETIKMLVSVGLGWSVLPRSLISEELRAVEIDGLAIQRELGVVWHARRTLSNAARAMIDILQEND